ncbi:hypothetical protein IWQ60_004532 [Tieghemiomyces parasiticus]|uniref:Uncharacterized protein n=1 Tax=Tieghemiomyces parasiticus TaxID=78921 RepID=A0A9W8DZA1_9FUNG|nr:hypothetical protein IWQ60_004532 [Tieghemiomyces parasiticus]
MWLTFDAMMRDLAQEKTLQAQGSTSVSVKSNRGQELELTADNPAPIPSQSVDGTPWLQKDAACIAESVVLQECVRYVWNYYQSYYEGEYAKQGFYHPPPVAASLQYYGQFSLKQCVEEHLSYRPTRVIFQKTAETVDKPSGYSMRLSTSELVLSCSAFDAYWDINDGQYYFQAIRGDTWYTVIDNALVPRADLGSNLPTRVRLDPEFWYTSSLHDVDAGQLADSSPVHQFPQEIIVLE